MNIIDVWGIHMQSKVTGTASNLSIPFKMIIYDK